MSTRSGTARRRAHASEEDGRGDQFGVRRVTPIDKLLQGFKTTGVYLTGSEQESRRVHAHALGGHGGVGEHQHIEARDSGLFLIGLFKLAKAIFFLGVSLGALHFIHHDLSQTAERFLLELHFDPESRVIDFVTDKLAQVTHHKLRLISLGTFLYAGLCCTEAYGLLRRKVWAEFVTLWLSVSFVPWEAWELARRPSLWHVVILAANLVIVAYLLWMLRRKKGRRSPTSPARS
jgi:uncharacterized membrane protein (DUF2068 family)